MPPPSDIRAAVWDALARRRLALLRLQMAARLGTFRAPVPDEYGLHFRVA